nr:hypothetical protein [Tanacetum cinerariifolium]
MFALLKPTFSLRSLQLHSKEERSHGFGRALSPVHLRCSINTLWHDPLTNPLPMSSQYILQQAHGQSPWDPHLAWCILLSKEVLIDSTFPCYSGQRKRESLLAQGSSGNSPNHNLSLDSSTSVDTLWHDPLTNPLPMSSQHILQQAHGQSPWDPHLAWSLSILRSLATQVRERGAFGYWSFAFLGASILQLRLAARSPDANREALRMEEDTPVVEARIKVEFSEEEGAVESDVALDFK